MPPIFVMVQLMITSGGFNGVMRFLIRFIRGPISAQIVTAVMGLICFIDDYANAIIVGSMAQPLTDRYKISREKLAFIVDATSAPVAGLAVISTWIAYETGLFSEISTDLDMGMTGYAMFFDALAFRYYCWVMLFFVFASIVLAVDFGPMRIAEDDARNKDHDNFSGGDLKDVIDLKGSALCAVLPIVCFLLFHISGLWLDGGGPGLLKAGGSVIQWDYWRQVISSAKNSTVILDMSALCGMTTALVLAVFVGKCGPDKISKAFMKGLKRALLPIGILILAWSLKSVCKQLGTGPFIASLLVENVSAGFFAPLVFVAGAVISFSTGTSYGTMAILIPTAVPVAYALDGDIYGPTTIITLAAVLDGAIFGDHCSPISDTTIISSTSSACPLMRHVRTQLPYSIFVAVLVLALAYIPVSNNVSNGLVFAMVISAVVALLIIIKVKSRTANVPAN